ncbi:Protein Hook -like protein 3 [Triplophysa tibetana]|uniref:Protein Hook homolog 3 n=1 Tax=Triplophysa tibetana TaxID=1572043 RepID=A0A5A9P6D8_9TELE|nr:Protein Hook -like protein 3 [Triplophysa tibetana]
MSETLGRVEVCESLLTWIQTFGVEVPCSSVDDLTSGMAMAQVLQKIDAVHFTDAWIARIKADVGDNWRLKVSNLKKILKGILDYNHEVLGQQMNDFTLPDVSLIGEHSDPCELGRMLQLILGCAVNCEQKQGSDSYIDLERQLKKTAEDLTDALSTKEEIAQRCHELDMQAFLVQEQRDRLRLEFIELEERVAGLQEEKSSLLAENQVLMERLNQSDSIEDLNSPAGRRHLQLQTQLEQLQEETFRLEAAKDDYRIRCEELEKELVEVRGQNEDLTSLADEAQSLKDEIDVLRHSSDKVSKLEAQVEAYKKKLEDLGDLRRQVKLLEEKNSSYMQNTVTLEEDLRKANATRGQLETYKRQVVELQNKLSEESKKADKMEFEYKRVKEKVDSLQKDKDGFSSGLVPLGSNEPSDSLAAEIVTPEIRERLIRLQHENKMLKLAQEGSDNEQIALLTSLLEDANSRKNELETESSLILACHWSSCQFCVEGDDIIRSMCSAAMKRKCQEHLEKLRDASNEVQKKSCVIEEMESKMFSSAQSIEELEEALKKKDEEMKQMEERYKKYLEKAKSEYDKTKSQRDQEEKLIVSAWYNMGMALQKKASEDRLASTGSGQSFLARQRQATSARRAYPGHVQPTAARAALCFTRVHDETLLRSTLILFMCIKITDKSQDASKAERLFILYLTDA